MVKMIQKLESKLKGVYNFLKPGKPEYIIYGSSLPISTISGAFTYIITKNPYYASCATVTPQILEYISFRAMESGFFGNNLQNIVKSYK